MRDRSILSTQRMNASHYHGLFFKAVPLAWICSRLFCGDLNNLRVEAQVEPACSPFSFRIQIARLKWRLFLCKQTCHIPCKLSDNKSALFLAGNGIVPHWGFCRFRASNQAFDDSVVFQLFNIAQLRLRPSERRPWPERTVCLITLYIPWLAPLWDLSTWRSLLEQPCRDIDS